MTLPNNLEGRCSSCKFLMEWTESHGEHLSDCGSKAVESDEEWTEDMGTPVGPKCPHWELRTYED